MDVFGWEGNDMISASQVLVVGRTMSFLVSNVQFQIQWFHFQLKLVADLILFLFTAI